MMRWLWLLPLAGLLGLVAVAVPRIVAGITPAHEGPVYSVAAVEDHLRRDPGAWLGRTVRVRAMAAPCPWWGDGERARHCTGRPLVLIDAADAPPGEPLPLVRAEPSPLLALARRLPDLGGLVPRPAEVPLFGVTRFRVRLQRLPGGACGRSPCYAALLLDGTSISLQGSRT